MIELEKRLMQKNAQRMALIKFFTNQKPQVNSQHHYFILFQAFNSNIYEQIFQGNSTRKKKEPISAMRIFRTINLFYMTFGQQILVMINPQIFPSGSSVSVAGSGTPAKRSSYLPLFENLVSSQVYTLMKQRIQTWTYSYGSGQMFDLDTWKFCQIGAAIIRIWGQITAPTTLSLFNFLVQYLTLNLIEVNSKLIIGFQAFVLDKTNMFFRFRLAFSFVHMLSMWIMMLVDSYLPCAQQSFFSKALFFSKQLQKITDEIFIEKGGNQAQTLKNKKSANLEIKNKYSLYMNLMHTQHEKLMKNKQIHDSLRALIQRYKKSMADILDEIMQKKQKDAKISMLKAQQADKIKLLLSLNVIQKKNQQQFAFLLQNIKKQIKVRIIDLRPEAMLNFTIFNSNIVVPTDKIPLYTQWIFDPSVRKIMQMNFSKIITQIQSKPLLKAFYPSQKNLQIALNQTRHIIPTQFIFNQQTLQNKVKQLSVNEIPKQVWSYLQTTISVCPPWQLGYRVPTPYMYPGSQRPLQKITYKYNLGQWIRRFPQARQFVDQFNMQFQLLIHQRESYFKTTQIRYTLAKVPLTTINFTFPNTNLNFLFALVDDITYSNRNNNTTPPKQLKTVPQFAAQIAQQFTKYYKKEYTDLSFMDQLVQKGKKFDLHYSPSLRLVDNFSNNANSQKLMKQLKELKDSYVQITQKNQQLRQSQKTQILHAKTATERLAEKQKVIFQNLARQATYLAENLLSDKKKAVQKKHIIDYFNMLATKKDEKIQNIIKSLLLTIVNPSQGVIKLKQMSDVLRKTPYQKLSQMNPNVNLQTLAETIYQYMITKMSQNNALTTISKQIQRNQVILLYYSELLGKQPSNLSVEQKYLITTQIAHLKSSIGILQKQLQRIVQPIVAALNMYGFSNNISHNKWKQQKNPLFYLPQIKSFFKLLTEKKVEKINAVSKLVDFNKMDKTVTNRIQQAFQIVQKLNTSPISQISALQKQYLKQAEERGTLLREQLIHQLINTRMVSQKHKAAAQMSESMFQQTKCVWKHFFLNVDNILLVYEQYLKFSQGFHQFARSNYSTQFGSNFTSIIGKINQTFLDFDRVFALNKNQLIQGFGSCTSVFSAQKLRQKLYLTLRQIQGHQQIIKQLQSL